MSVNSSDSLAILGWNTGLGQKPLFRRGGSAAIAFTLLLVACGTGGTTGEAVDDTTPAPTTRSDTQPSDTTSAEEMSETSPASNTSPTTTTASAAPSTDAQQPEKEESQIQVIVDLAVDWRPEAELGSEDEVSEQRAAIRAAQDAVVELLAETDFEVVQRYDATPQMALHVDAAALELLRASSLVSQVTEDVPAAPTG